MNSSRPAFSIRRQDADALVVVVVPHGVDLRAAWSRLERRASPPSTVKSAATRLSTSRPHSPSASSKPWLRSWVSGSESMPAISATTASGLSPQLGADVGAGRDAHAVVVAEDGDAGGVRVLELAVDVDDRDAGLHRLDGDRGQRGTVEGQQHDRVDTVVDEGLDLADLQVDVVGAFGDLQVDVRVLVGEVADVGDRGHPAVVGGGGGEADGDGVALLVVRALPRPRGRSRPPRVGRVGGGAGAGGEGEHGDPPATRPGSGGSAGLRGGPQGHGCAPWCGGCDGAVRQSCGWCGWQIPVGGVRRAPR